MRIVLAGIVLCLSEVWFHDIFRQDGTPYDPEEVAYIRRVTGR